MKAEIIEKVFANVIHDLVNDFDDKVKKYYTENKNKKIV